MIADECVGKSTVASVGETRGGPRVVERGPHSFSRPEEYVGNAEDSLSDIRYSHRPPITLLSLSLFLPLYPVRHRDLLLYDPHMCFVCTRHVTYGPCVIYHTALAADRERGCTPHSTNAAPPLTMLRLIMLISPQRHKLNGESLEPVRIIIVSFPTRCTLDFHFSFSPAIARARASRVSTLRASPFHALHRSIVPRSPSTRRYVSRGMLIVKRIPRLVDFLVLRDFARVEPKWRGLEVSDSRELPP